MYLLPLTSAFGPGSLQGASALRRFLREQQVQVVQTFFESSDLWAGLVTRLFSPAKLIWSRRDMGILRQRKHSFAYRALRRLPHAVLAVSARVAEHVTTVDGVPSSRVRVVYNGLDLDASPTPAPSVNEPVVTTIGNIRRVKGHDVLLQAAPAILARFPRTIFTFAGEILEPAYFAELQRTVTELGLSDHVRFLGKVTDLRAHLSTASLFVLPSRSEGFSNALIEAMAAGVPVVATDVGGNAEAVENGVNGFVVAPDNATRLAEAMLKILEDGVLAQSFGLAARRSVQEKFTTKAMMRAVVGTYQELLAK